MQLRLVEAGRRVALNAVDEPLERADADPVVAEARRDAGIRQATPLVERRAREDTDGELAATFELVVDRKLERRGDVVDRRDAELGEMLLRRPGFAEPLIESLRCDGTTHAREGAVGHAPGRASTHPFQSRDRLRA